MRDRPPFGTAGLGRARSPVVEGGRSCARVLLGLLLIAVSVSGCAAAAPVTQDPSTAESAGLTAATGTAEAPKDPGKSSSIDPAVDSSRLLQARVSRVVDGDTVWVTLEDGAREKVRFIGVDTPESTIRLEPYGREASAYTSRALSDRQVYLEKDIEERDRYGRLLAYVWTSVPGSGADSEIRQKMFNARLLLDGYAQQLTMPPNVKHADRFQEYAKEARLDGRGLWGPDVGTSAPSPPSGQGAPYVGNRNSKKFHFAACGSVGAMSPRNKVALSSREDALAGGFVPCKRCRP